MSKKNENIENSILESAKKLEQQPTQPAAEEESILAEEGISQDSFDKEIELEKKYGDSPVKAALAGAARGLSLGLSDVALTKAGLATPEELREIDERNKEASVVGEVTGTIAPILATGGTSLLAKGATKGGAAVLGAEAARKTTEKIAAQALKNVLKEKGKQKVYKEILKKALPKAAGSAAEGVFYSTGKLLSEDALGRADLNAENITAAVGQGAILGGAFGGLLGTAEALVPVVKGGKVVNFTKKKGPKVLDPDKAAKELTGYTPIKAQKLDMNKPDVSANIAPLYRKIHKQFKPKNAQEYLEATTEFQKKVGDDIGEVLIKIDSLADDAVLPTKDALGKKVVQELEQIKGEFKGVLSTSAKRKIKQIDNEIKLFEDWAGDFSKVKGTELQKMKSKYYNLSNYDKDVTKLTLADQINRAQSRAMRKEVEAIAERVSTVDDNVAQKLKSLNLDFATTAENLKHLPGKVSKDGNKDFLGLKDYALLGTGGIIDGAAGAMTLGALRKLVESDQRRKLVVLAGVEKANAKVASKINKGVTNFVNSTARVARPTSTKILTSFTLNPERKKKPQNKQEAFKALSDDIIKYTVQPEKLAVKLSNNLQRLTSVAPQTSQHLLETSARAIQFLKDKLPINSAKEGALDSFLKKKWQPSTLELAKFERYIEAIENPLSAIDDLEQGSLTREKVEAIKTVYPNLYTKIQEITLDTISKNSDKIDYKKRLELGVLLDIPSDTALLPENIRALQSVQEDDQQQYSNQTAGSSVNTTLGGLKQLSFGEDAQTVVERTIKSE